MTLKRTIAPEAEPVTLAEAKLHLKRDDTDDDDLITALIQAAREHIESWSDRLLVSQTWQMTLHCFPRSNGAIRIPKAPLRSITSITYTDQNGDGQTFSSSLYTVDANDKQGWVYLAYNQDWPDTRGEPNAVTITFVGGYAPGSASPVDHAENVPQPIKRAMLLLVGHWYANREAVNVGSSVNEMPMAVDALLTPYRVWGVA